MEYITDLGSAGEVKANMLVLRMCACHGIVNDMNSEDVMAS
jgi:hypothetical protein